MNSLYYNSHFADEHEDLPGKERPEQEVELELALDFEEDEPEIDVDPVTTTEPFCPDIAPEDIPCSINIDDVGCSLSNESEEEPKNIWDRIKQAGSSRWMRLFLIIGGITVLTQGKNNKTVQ